MKKVEVLDFFVDEVIKKIHERLNRINPNEIVELKDYRLGLVEAYVDVIHIIVNVLGVYKAEDWAKERGVVNGGGLEK